MYITEAFSIFIYQFLFQFPYMTLAWILCIYLNNGSFVDLAWPSGFLIMSLNFINNKGWYLRKIIIIIPLILCAIRFVIGWLVFRKHHIYEDSRWKLWRERWRNGNGILGIKSVPFNFFFFYHSQSLTNAFIISFPLILMTNNEYKSLYFLEIIGLLLWVSSFLLENIADSQLSKFKRKKTNGVLQEGLWKYSRHPNYFFEWMVWNSYVLMSLPSVNETWQYFYLILLPIVTYYFLVYFTGVPMAEESSLKKRGEIYSAYQKRTNMFFPWIPRI